MSESERGLAGAAGAPRGRSSTETGMLLVSAAMLMVPSADALAKFLSDFMTPSQVVFTRFVLQSLILLTWLRLRGHTIAVTKPLLHMLGGALVGGAIMTFYWSLKFMPIANAIAIFFVEPLILTAFSAVLLRESVGPRRIAAVLVGLIGAMIVIRPNWSAFGWVSILPLYTATFFASYLVITRHLAGSGGRVAFQFWISLYGSITTGVVLLIGNAADIPAFDVVMPELWQWGVLLLLGFMTMAAHLLIAIGYGHAPASVLAPFQYLEIFSATLLGLIFFGDFPDMITWLGTAIIIASGLYVFRREQVLARGGAVVN